MSQPIVDVDERSVVASLHLGPAGTLRLTYEYPQFDEASASLRGFGTEVQANFAYLSSVIEIDEAKLRELRFSQQELAEIGFSLVARLSALVRYPSPDSSPT